MLRHLLRNLFSPASDADSAAAARLEEADRLREAHRNDEAYAIYSEVLKARPHSFEAHLGSGVICFRENQFETAERHFREALALRPDSEEAENWLTYLLDISLRYADFMAHQQEIQRVRPTDGRAVMLALMIPQHYDTVAEIDETRVRLASEIRKLLDGPSLSVADPSREIGITMFRLAYHGRNDRELQQLATRLVRKAYQPRRCAPLERKRSGKIRIGFFSEHLNSHSIGRLNEGIISSLSREDFEVRVFSFARHRDPLSQRILASADSHIAFGEESLAQIEDTIAEQALDVLFFPDIGMDPLTYFLAYSRLAPVQCVTWGHPVTTGIDTVDYFVSGAVVDPPGSEACYTETLARLPAFFMPPYERPRRPAPRRTRAELGLPDSRRLYVCPQTLFKMHPDFDWALSEILRRDGEGEIVLLHDYYPLAAEVLQRRFARAFSDVACRVRFLPRLSHPDFLNLLAVSDVMLDPFHFGGGNTSCEGIAMGTPVVTLPAPFLRGRLTLGCHVEMGLDECVAQTPEHYVEIATRLAGDPDYRSHVTGRMAERDHLLFHRQDLVRALEDYLRKLF